MLVVAIFNPLVLVILEEYGIAFLLLLPLLFIPAWAAIALGAVLLTVAPALTAMASRDPAVQAAADGDFGIVLDWFITGAYPVIIWVPVMLIGLGLARLDVASPRVLPWYGLVGIAATAVCLPIVREMPANQVLGADPAADWMIPVRASLMTIGNVGFYLGVVAIVVALTAQPGRACAAW